MSRSVTARILVVILGSAALISAAGCDVGSQRRSAADEAALLTGPVGEVVPTVRIKPGSRYYVGNDQFPVSATHLSGQIRAFYTVDDAQGVRVLRVLAYQGVGGYDATIVTNAARDAGVHRIEGIAEYTDDASAIRQRLVWKRWEHDLAALPVYPVVEQDTPISGR
ncbi:hypothetical protein BH23GEM3_BH23GEM3_20380 [soil metagenome]|nr:hypothetical protein [Gemmatimonadota bacterium]